MSSTESTVHGRPSRTFALWLGLVLATLLTRSLGGHGAGPALTAALLAIAATKGAAVALDFMALKAAGRLWRGIVLGWLGLVCTLIGLAYWKGIA